MTDTLRAALDKDARTARGVAELLAQWEDEDRPITIVWGHEDDE